MEYSRSPGSAKTALQSPPAKRKRARLFAALPVIVGLALLVWGGLGLWQRYSTTHNPNPLPDGAKAVTHSTDSPDETPIGAESEYLVAPDQPRAIILPTIGAQGFIQKVGIDQNGAVAVPGNVHMAGWFIGESVPGEPGLSIVDGHVQGRYQPGIFKNLGELRLGDRFTIEFGDRSAKSFEVVSVTSYPTDEAAKHLFHKDGSIPSQLNLITCSGSYNRADRQYDQRLLVVSKAI